MNKKVLIFGAGGFVGKYLAKEFSSNNYKVYGSDKNSSNNINEFYEFYKCDLLDINQVSSILKEVNPTHIINLAAISSVGLSWKIPQVTISVNVIGTLNILESVKEICPLSKILFIGSSEEYAPSENPIDESNPLNANNPYGISKAVQEQFSEIYRKRYGLKIYYVRPFNHTGVGQSDSFVIPSFCKQVAEIEKHSESGTIYVGNLEVKRDFSNVKDIARAYRMIIESNDCNIVYNVGSGTAVSLKEILNYIVGLSTKHIEIEIDKDLFRPSDNPVICCNSKLIYEKTGWKPEYNIYDTIKEMYDFYLKK